MKLSFETFVAWRYLRERGSRAGFITMGVGAALLVAAKIITQLSQKTVVHAFGIRPEVVINQPLMIAGLVCAVVGVLVVVFGTFHSLQSIFTTISTFGVFLGTAALVVVLSVMNGFEVDLRQKILGSNAHIQISRADGAFTEWREIQKKIAGACTRKGVCVVATTPFLTSEVVVAANSNYQPVIIKGIDPATVVGVTDLLRSVTRMILSDEDPNDMPEEGSPRWERAKKRAQEQVRRIWPMADDGAVREGTTAGDTPPRPAPQGPAAQGDDEEPEDFSGGAPASAPASAPAASAARAPAREPAGDDEPVDFSGLGPDAGTRVVVGRHKTPIGEEPRLDPAIAALDGELVGAELAKSLHLYPGEEVTVVSPLGRDTPTGQVPRVRQFRVAGKFLTGMYEYDTKSVYVSLPALQSFLSLGDEVNGIEVKASDANASPSLVRALQARLGPAYEVKDWQDLNHNLFSALKLEKIVMFIVLAVIILVASFSIVSNLIMVVVEKGREIAILKSMGASDATVMRVFVIEGAYIGVMGTLFGLVIGIGTCIWLKVSGLPLDAEVYYISRLPVAMDPLAIVAVAFAGVAISVIATVYPSYIAARLRPIDGLRYE